METREIVSWSMEPKAPSRVLVSEDVLQPTRAILIFPKPSHFSLAVFLLNELLFYQCQALKREPIKRKLRKRQFGQEKGIEI